MNRKLGSAESTQYHKAVHLRGRNRQNALFFGKPKVTTNKFKRKKKRDVKMEDYIAKSNHTNVSKAWIVIVSRIK